MVRGPGTLIYGKNLMSKISCQTAFKYLSWTAAIDFLFPFEHEVSVNLHIAVSAQYNKIYRRFLL